MSAARDQHPGITAASPVRRYALLRGLYFHLAIFAIATLVMFLLNANTRGPDGGWWVVWPLQLWAIAWGLHLWGVTLGSSISQPSE